MEANDLQQKIDFLLYLADTNLILSQRNAEWCGHGPILEQDIAITNITLDLLGQARNFYQYAALLTSQLTSEHITEDQLAYLRGERDFKNLLLAEFPKGDWAFTTVRQYFISQYFELLYEHLSAHADHQIAAIAAKALKEVRYHVRWSGEWVIRLGDGTEESNRRANDAVKEQMPYTGEMFIQAPYEKVADIDVSALKDQWKEKVGNVLSEATIPFNAEVFMHTGGKQGVHTEHLGFILAEMQYLQRSIPGAEW